jgi:hypothetical protein
MMELKVGSDSTSFVESKIKKLKAVILNSEQTIQFWTETN